MLTIDSSREKPSKNQKRFQLNKNLPLEVGNNKITIEAIDSIGQIAKSTFTVLRKAPAVVKTEPTPLSEQEFLAQLTQMRGDVYAVIIGIGDYLDPKIPDLSFTENDAQGFYDVLTAPQYGGVPKNQVILLLHKDATERNIRKAIGTWLRRNAGKDDTVIIYYSGHGAPEDKDTYWVTYDTQYLGQFHAAIVP